MARQFGQIRIVSSNLEKVTPPGHMLNDAAVDVAWVDRKWGPSLDIWGAQEAKQYIELLKKCKNVKVALPREVNHPDELNNPVMYNPETMKHLGSKIIMAHPGQKHAFPMRIIQSTKFKWIGGDGSIVYYNNTHLNSHIEVAGGPRALPRVKLSSHHLELLAQTMKGDSRGRQLAFGGGDMNVDEDAEQRVHWSGFPSAIMDEYGITSIYEELHTPRTFDTHTSRKIDNIFSCNNDTRASAVRVIRSDDRRSDHYFIKGTYKVRLL